MSCIESNQSCEPILCPKLRSLPPLERDHEIAKPICVVYLCTSSANTSKCDHLNTWYHKLLCQPSKVYCLFYLNCSSQSTLQPWFQANFFFTKDGFKDLDKCRAKLGDSMVISIMTISSCMEYDGNIIENALF